MANDRPSVPAVLKRRLYEEAGYRCAIPACRGTSALEMAHIDPWVEVQEHSFENMIVLCAVDHARYDTKLIPKQSIRAFKAGLSVVNARYGDLEQRLLHALVDKPVGHKITLSGDRDLEVMYLLDDRVIARDKSARELMLNGTQMQSRYELTEHGVAFIKDWRAGTPLV